METAELRTVHWIIFSQTDWEIMQSEEGFLFYIFFLSLSFSYYTMCLNYFS